MIAPQARRRGQVLVAALTSVLVLLGGVTSAASADDLSNKRKQAEQQIATNDAAQEALDASLEGLSGDLAVAAAELAAIQAQLPAAQQKLADAKAALATAQRQAQLIADQLADAKAQEATLGDTIATTDARQAEIRASIGQMARVAARGGDVSELSVVLGATDSADFVARYAMASTAQRTQQQVLDELATLASANRNSETRLAAVRDKITQLKAAADQKVIEADQARQDAADAKAQIDALVLQQQQKQASIQGQIAQAQEQEAQLAADRAALEADLATIIEQQRIQREKEKASGNSTTTPGTALPGAWFSNPSATSPIYVTSEYGWRLHPVLGYWRMHSGIDLRDYCGQPVYAGRDGTVVWAKYRSGYGNQVMVDHGWVNNVSLMSSYNHMSSFAVSAGTHVSAGQLIGRAGNTGTSAACHLHFEVYLNGATVNPRSYLGI